MMMSVTSTGDDMVFMGKIKVNVSKTRVDHMMIGNRYKDHQQQTSLNV